MPSRSPSELIQWYAERTGCAKSEIPTVESQITKLVHDRVADLVERMCGPARNLDQATLDIYRGRGWLCVEHHARAIIETEPIRFHDLLDRLEAGRLSYGQVGANVLEEVVLAQGLELGETAAANRFDRDYMPAVRRAAQKVGGQRAMDAVENFAAELVLPRENHPPRISTFIGRTPLATWLRTVVVNFWVTQTRREKYERPAETPEVIHRDSLEHEVDGIPCREMLEPVFRQAAESIDAKDRLLLKLLLLDGVPQKDVARAMKLNSGTITRRRQKAAEQVLLGVRQQVEQMERPERAHRCLELALTGDLPELRSGLADVLALAVGDQATGRGAKEARR